MAHLCEAAVVTCEDFRLHQRKDGRNFIAEFVKGLDIEADVITRGGCIQDMVRPKPGFADSLLRDLGVSVNLHKVKLIYVIGHEDCGAYAHFNFPSREKEVAQHWQDLAEAKAVIEKAYPGVQVKTLFAELEPGSKDRFRLAK